MPDNALGVDGGHLKQNFDKKLNNVDSSCSIAGV